MFLGVLHRVLRPVTFLDAPHRVLPLVMFLGAQRHLYLARLRLAHLRLGLVMKKLIEMREILELPTVRADLLRVFTYHPLEIRNGGLMIWVRIFCEIIGISHLR